MALVGEHTKCLLEREIHPHVDVNIEMLPEEEQEGARRAIAQNLTTKAAINLYNALITALSETLIRSGGSESSDSENSMNPQAREYVVAQLEAFRAERDSIQMDNKMSKEVAATVSRLNERLDGLQETGQRNISGALSRGGSGAGASTGSYQGTFRR
jgi:hypothetical protein